MATMLCIRNLVKTYDGFSLDNVCLKVAEGCVTGFIGSNGAGKTTTIKSIFGIVTPDSGAIEIFGTEMDTHGVSAEVKERIGVVFDTCPFPSENRVLDVGLIGRFAFQKWDPKLFATLIKKFGITPKKQIKDLSRGMSMKLQIAFALAHHPDLLVLDEATAGLDPIARDEVLEIFREFMEDESHGILISSHITSDLEKIADEVVCIDNGHIVFDKSVDEICDVAGIAHCRRDEAKALLASTLFDAKDLFVVKNGYNIDVLIPDRAKLKLAFPEVACDRASLDDYMLFVLKGEKNLKGEKLS